MAFILPLTILGSSGIGFAAGYMMNGNSEKKIINELDKETEMKSISVSDLKLLKGNSPHKEIHTELITFDKKKLNKAVITKQTTDEQKLLEKLRESVMKRRSDICKTDIIENE